MTCIIQFLLSLVSLVTFNHCYYIVFWTTYISDEESIQYVLCTRGERGEIGTDQYHGSMCTDIMCLQMYNNVVYFGEILYSESPLTNVLYYSNPELY